MPRRPAIRSLLVPALLVAFAFAGACSEPVETAEVDASEITGVPMFQPAEPEEQPAEPATVAEAEPEGPVEPAPTVDEPEAAAEAPAAGETTPEPTEPAEPVVEDQPEEAPVAQVEPVPEPEQPAAETPAVEEPVAEQPAEPEPEPAPEPTAEPDTVAVGDVGTPEDQPERVKTIAEVKAEAKLLTFDLLASFVWVPPAVPTTEPGALGPPDPNADAGGVALGTDQTPTNPDHPTPSGEKTSDVPARIKAHTGKRVSVEGYMIPLEFDEEGGVRKFLLSRFMMGCCFGVVPQPNELVLVTMVNEEGAVYEPYLTVMATGVFSVDDDGTQLGTLQALYSISGDSCRFILDR